METEHRRSEKIVQTRNGGDGESGRCDEAAHQGQQRDHDQIGKRGCIDVGPEPEADKGHQCKSNAAESALRSGLPEPGCLISLHLRCQVPLRLPSGPAINNSWHEHLLVIVVSRPPLASRLATRTTIAEG